MNSFVGQFEESEARAPSQERGSGASRRLTTAAKTVMAFEESLSSSPDADSMTGVCRMVKDLCTERPYLFSPSTSCVCNGQWDYADTGSNVTSASPTARTGGHQRRLGGAAEPELGAPPRKLTSDPWQGSIGDYCDTWSGAADGQWCFVSAQQQCDGTSQKEYRTKSGVMLTRSSGPCTNEVESRSQFILDGLEAMLSSMRASAVLGGLLAFSAFCGALLYRSPSKQTTWVGKDARAFDYHGASAGKQNSQGFVGGHSSTTKPIDEQQHREHMFEEAQREAVRRLNDETPDDQKFMLYGFYKQAKEGDVQGERPAFWNSRERSKYDYWARHKGMSREQAIDAYIRTVQMLE